MKPIAADTNDFPRLRRENCIYVDKTEYVHRLVSQPGSRLFFMSRPRRFGKSLTLSVLKALFSGRRELFDGLFIAEKTDWNWNETYPIIHFEFNDVTTTSLEEYARALENHVKMRLQDAGYVCDEKLSAAENFGCAIKSFSAKNDGKGYAEPYLADGRPIWLIGLSFDSKTRNLVDFAAVRYGGKEASTTETRRNKNA